MAFSTPTTGELLPPPVQIDDVVDASPVHMFCGVWGVLAAGLLAEEDNYGEAYYSERQGDCCGAFYG